ncbi:MAG: hypothetical protein IKP35_00640 [Alphaproteobacteria bacterium]|nr:hypothetical protein [Alphaproteobacteria bacterium]
MKKTFVLLCCLVPLAHVAYAKLTVAKFPGTIDDMSFTSRMEIAAEGYKPFLDKSAYQELNIVPGEEIYTDHMIAVAEAEAEKAKEQEDYCKQHPEDKTKCPDKPVVTTAPVTTTVQSGIYSGRTIGGGSVIKNNSIVGGSCYPAAKDNHFTNKVLTTGKYEKIHPAFEKGLITVFRKEGGCGTIKNDPCGYTCYGIGSNCNGGTIVNSRGQAEDIYYKRYFANYKIDKLPDVISTDIFLASMASGPGTALSQFRDFLGLPKSTKSVDEEMINAVKNYPGDIHNKWMDRRDTFLQAVAQKRYNGSVSRGYKNAIEIKRKNGCHVEPTEPIYRQ